jgi:hypothetical protein
LLEIAAMAIFIDKNGRASARAPPDADLNSARTSIYTGRTPGDARGRTSGPNEDRKRLFQSA